MSPEEVFFSVQGAAGLAIPRRLHDCSGISECDSSPMNNRLIRRRCRLHHNCVLVDFRRLSHDCLVVLHELQHHLYLIQKMSRKEALTQFIQQIHGRPVVVKLNSGVDYRGVMACIDGYMNIALEQTEEYINGELKNKFGDSFIRGNNVLYISTQKRKGV
ncbi:hypothetical protein ACI65C_000538 [Semiaphis heraclei]